MAVYSRPEVFIEESLSPLTESVKGVPGVALGAFIGAYHRGPNTATVVTSWNQFTRLFGDFGDSQGSFLPYAVYMFFANGGGACAVARVENSDAEPASVTLVDKTTPSAEDILQVNAKSPGEWGNELYVAVVAGTSDRFNFIVYRNGTTDGHIVERFVDMSVNPADHRYIVNTVNSPFSGSDYVSLVNLKDVAGWVYTAGTDNPDTVTATPLTDGDDGSVVGDLAGLGTQRLDALEGAILNVNLPGVSNSAVLNDVIEWAVDRGDALVVCDGPPPPNGTQTSTQVAAAYLTLENALQGSDRGSLYAPWLLAGDPSASVPGATRWLPPGGAVLGQFMKNDTLRGVQKTPAGINTILAGVLGLETRFTSTNLDALNEAGVNAIKSVPGKGFCIFGGRTLNKGYPTRYVAVRRTLTQLEHDFKALTQFAIFEPNGPELWLQINAVLSNYLVSQMQQGVLPGATADQAFVIVCDESNNPPHQANAGVVNVDVNVAVASPAEFITIRVTQVQGSSATSAIL